MSDAELYAKLLSGMRVAEQEIVKSIEERTGLTNFGSLIGGYLFNDGVIALRRLMSDYLISRGNEGVVAAFVKAAQTHDVEELRMFIDETDEADNYTPGDAVHGQGAGDDSPPAPKAKR